MFILQNKVTELDRVRGMGRYGAARKKLLVKEAAKKTVELARVVCCSLHCCLRKAFRVRFRSKLLYYCQ